MNGPRSSSTAATSTLPPGRGIAERVAHQIADQDAQRIVLTRDHTASRDGWRHTEVDLPSIRQWQMLGDDLCCQLGKLHRYQWPLATARFLAGQGKELLHRMGGALQPAFEFGECFGT
jgi:hypothetical protein